MEPIEQKSYWSSVFLAGIAFGLISFALTTALGYYQLSSNSTLISSVSGTAVCLLSGFGGMLAIWHYTRDEENMSMTLGNGAVVGLITGLLIGIIMVALILFWQHFVDPSFTQRLLDHEIAKINARPNMSTEQKQKVIDLMHHISGTMLMVGYLFRVLGLGVVNLLTGMLGAKIFAKNE